MINEKAIFLFMLLMLVVAGIAGAILNTTALQKADDKGNGGDSEISTFEECAAAGNPVQESYPRQCRTADGKLFVEEIDAIGGKDDGDAADKTGGCVPAGCSSQLCVEEYLAENIITTCEWRAEYACYREAVCERQESGACGWTETPELVQCLHEASAAGLPRVIQ